MVVGDRVRSSATSPGDPDRWPGSSASRTARACCGAAPTTPTTREPVERPIVANADQLAVVTALADPEPRPRMVDRCLVAAYDAGLDPLLVLTKADLTDPAPFLAAYAPLDVPYVVTRRDRDGSSRGSTRCARGWPTG